MTAGPRGLPGLRRQRRDKSAALHASVESFGITLHPKQARFVCSPRKRIALCAGRGLGKTDALDLKAILLALQNPGLSGAVLCPTYKQLHRNHEPRIHRYFREFRLRTGVNLVARWYGSEKRWRLINGAEIWLLSFERYENLAGYDLGWACVDEITTHTNPDKVMQVLEPAVRAPGGSHHIAFTFTPRGYRSVLKQFVENTKAGLPDWQLVHGTSFDNPHLDPANIQRWMARLSKSLIEQEIFAKILRPSSLVYSEFQPKHVIPWVFDSTLPYILACDWGDSHPYYAIIQLAPVDGVEALIVCHEFCEDDVSWQQSKRYLRELVDDCGREPEMVVGDRAVKEMMNWAAWAFPNAHVRKMETKDEQSVWQGVQTVKCYLDPVQGPPKLYVATHLETGNPRGAAYCFRHLERTKTPSGEPIDQVRKDNVTDHAHDAIRMAVVAYERYNAITGDLPSTRLPERAPHRRLMRRGGL